MNFTKNAQRDLILKSVFGKLHAYHLNDSCLTDVNFLLLFHDNNPWRVSNLKSRELFTYIYTSSIIISFSLRFRFAL